MIEKVSATDNLIGTPPPVVLLHGPKKILLDKYHWHSPEVGIVASYTPVERDVEDHFGIFRGVDQIEAFAQATIVSLGAFSEKIKLNCTFDDLKRTLVPVFLGLGQVTFHNYVEKGETFISMGHITFYKFRQMVCNGRIYKVPPGLDLDSYFSGFTDERLLAYDISSDFILVAELEDVKGRALKKEKFT